MRENSLVCRDVGVGSSGRKTKEDSADRVFFFLIKKKEKVIRILGLATLVPCCCGSDHRGLFMSEFGN